MVTFLTDSTDITRIHFASKLTAKQRSELGQFLTPAPVARFMAEQFGDLAGDIRLLDPGAGVGSLTAAFVERLLISAGTVNSVFITAYEVEASFLSSLHQRLAECCTALERKGIKADYCLYEKSFIEAAVEVNLPLFPDSATHFTHTILNPPYKKIHSQSLEKKILSNLGIETVNFYSAFVWLAMSQLIHTGEMVAITPRSFCNGTYFRPFRRALLNEMEFRKIHVFESRSVAFAEDNVLQENLIFNATKTKLKPACIEVTNHFGNTLNEIAETRLVPYQEVVDEGDPEQFIHVITNALEDALRVQMEQLPCTLNELGLEVSTGPVVDFRLKSALQSSLNEKTVPLIYPESIRAEKVVFPPKQPRKAIAIEHNPETQKWLVPSGWYVLTKRFSAKEEKRRVVAAVCAPMREAFLGIENHLNYFHAKGEGMNPDLARGLAAFLNSTLFDNAFRQFSGHTQINATDLRRIKYPSKADLIALGRQIDASTLDQKALDELVHTTLSIMSDATQAIQASRRKSQMVLPTASTSALFNPSLWVPTVGRGASDLLSLGPKSVAGAIASNRDDSC